MAASTIIINDNSDIESNIHFIWLGSVLREAHVEKIKLWRILNPVYQIYIWVEPAYKQAIETQLFNFNIEIKLINDVHFNQITDKFLSKLTETREDESPPNYAARSDCDRLKIIYDFGGWYADTDVTPIDLSKIKISPLFRFYINAKRNNFFFQKFSPSIFACGRQHILLRAALDFLDLLSTNAIEKHVDSIRSMLASIRYPATVFSTGAILSLALQKLYINNMPLIENGNLIPNTEIYDLIASPFESHFERSWLLAAESKPTDQKHNQLAIPGLRLDKHYLENESECLKGVPEIKELMRSVFREIKAYDLNITEEQYFKYRTMYNQVGLFAHGDKAPLLPILQADSGLGL